jgi:predicted nucleic acid-binding protein
MNSLNFPTDPQVTLIGDASVVINLVATGHASEIIGALPNPFAITDNAYTELEDGSKKGHDDHEQLVRLIAAGLAKRVTLGASALTVYETLIDGSNVRTLDDGEAATIAYAHEASGVALIDERKARSLCAAFFPRLIVISTVEILMHSAVSASLGEQGQADAIFNALTIGRMRVPVEHVSQVRRLIGDDRAAQCSSLPKAWRKPRGER